MMKTMKSAVFVLLIVAAGCNGAPASRTAPPPTEQEIQEMIEKFSRAAETPAAAAPARPVIVRTWTEPLGSSQIQRREWSDGRDESLVPNTMDWARAGFPAGEWMPTAEFEAENRRSVADGMRKIREIQERTDRIWLRPTPCNPLYDRDCR